MWPVSGTGQLGIKYEKPRLMQDLMGGDASFLVFLCAPLQGCSFVAFSVTNAVASSLLILCSLDVLCCNEIPK